MTDLSETGDLLFNKYIDEYGNRRIDGILENGVIIKITIISLSAILASTYSEIGSGAIDVCSRLKLASIVWYKREVSPSYGTVGYTTVTVETIFSDVQAPDPRQISVVFNLRSQLDPRTTLSTTVGVYSLATKVFKAIGSIPLPENVPLNCYDLEIEVNYFVT